MTTADRTRPPTGRQGRIGPIGTTARVIVGLFLLASLFLGQLAAPVRPSSWALGLLGFPALLLAWQWLRARRVPARLQATGPVAHALISQGQSNGVMPILRSSSSGA
jgi:hypothetical protein